MKPRIPTDAQIVDTFHAVAEFTGRYDRDDCIDHAIEQLTPADADEDERGTIAFAVRKAWASRMEVWGVC